MRFKKGDFEIPKFRTKPKTPSQYMRICGFLYKCSKAYYDEAWQPISDREYDKLLDWIIEAEEKHPEWLENNPYSPTQNVGSYDAYKEVK